MTQTETQAQPRTRKRAGRPSREHPPGERVSMSFRVTPELKAEMDLVAAASGRSVTQELEFLLEQASLFRRLVGGSLRPLLPVIIEFDRVGADYAQRYGIEGDWTQNQDAYMLALTFALKTLLDGVPGPWDGKVFHGMVEHAFEMAEHNRRRAAGLVRGEGFITEEERAATSADKPAPPAAKDAA